ncbi:hypothetical protein CRG98_040219 [Punica granatum]|uniref:Legume lectin domain-containing protein n=1 Tax=Punica granatum TaxID=22663 RepID=A0A2I0I6B6_PUNGR|nr:hypothetical protein CRG98_040219 [Punica granatum]
MEDCRWFPLGRGRALVGMREEAEMLTEAAIVFLGCNNHSWPLVPPQNTLLSALPECGDHRKSCLWRLEIPRLEISLAMGIKQAVLLFLLASSGSAKEGFTYNGFQSADLALDFAARYTPDGLLALSTNHQQKVGRAFYPEPVTFKNSSSNGTVISLSTTFMFAIIPGDPIVSGHGMTFVGVPERGVPGALPSQYIGLFNGVNIGNPANHIFAIELGMILNLEFEDVNNNHVGIDFNGLFSTVSAPAGYYPDGHPESLVNLSLISGEAMHVWVEYDGIEKQINVTSAPSGIVKPRTPLLSLLFDLLAVFKNMYVGFFASAGSHISSHYLLSWSFQDEWTSRETLSAVASSGFPQRIQFKASLKRKFMEVLEDWIMGLTGSNTKISTSLLRDLETRSHWGAAALGRGEILEARDRKLGTEFVAEEVELVLKLGLLCMHSEPRATPSMRQVVQYLEGGIALQVVSSSLVLSASGLIFARHEGFDEHPMSSLPAEDKEFSSHHKSWIRFFQPEDDECFEYQSCSNLFRTPSPFLSIFLSSR